jgi:hypothetical protein
MMVVVGRVKAMVRVSMVGGRQGEGEESVFRIMLVGKEREMVKVRKVVGRVLVNGRGKGQVR